MSDVKDRYGKVVYRITGDRIYDVYGNWKYTIAGDRINDAYGDWKYMIRGDYLYDTYGNRLGEMRNLGELLDSHKEPSGNVIPPPPPPPLPEPGCLGSMFLILSFLFKANWGGRIGIVLGVIFLIVDLTSGISHKDNAVIMGIILIFVFGIVGAGIGAIIKSIANQTDKNTNSDFLSLEIPDDNVQNKPDEEQIRKILKDLAEKIDAEIMLSRKNDPNYHKTMSGIINRMREKDGPDVALNGLNRNIAKTPNILEAYLVRGELHNDMKNAQMALNDFGKAIEINSNESKSYLLRGSLYAKLGNIQEAIRDYEKFLELDPNNEEAKLIRAALNDVRRSKTPQKPKLPLITDGGNGHNAIVIWWFVGGIGAVVFFALCYYFANNYGISGTFKNNIYNISIGAGVLSAVFCLILSGVTNSRISKTTVKLTDIIEGVSVIPKFPMSFMLFCSISSLKLMKFRLTYDKIFSVDVVNGGVIVINTANAQHKIYVKNAIKIRDEIMRRKKIMIN